MQKIKQYIAEYLRKKLFATEYAKLELARRTVDGKSHTEQIQILTRANLASFDVKALDSDDDVLELAEAHGWENQFLAQVKDLRDNTALKNIVEMLKRDQMAFGAKEAVTLDQLNFSRGSINGVVLLEDTIDRLYGVYRERVSPDEEYDNHEVI